MIYPTVRSNTTLSVWFLSSPSLILLKNVNLKIINNLKNFNSQGNKYEPPYTQANNQHILC